VLVDVLFGLRYFGRTPFSTTTVVLVLALGMGVNTALFTMLHSLATQPPNGIPRDAALVRIRGLHQSQTRGASAREISYPELRDYAAHDELFSSVAGWTGSAVVFDFGNGARGAVAGGATYVTEDYFRVLGVRPVVGAGSRLQRHR
ncbi:MAG: ABC transporter permease, partial [Longimicrobiales bacterium]